MERFSYLSCVLSTEGWVNEAATSRIRSAQNHLKMFLVFYARKESHLKSRDPCTYAMLEAL